MGVRCLLFAISLLTLVGCASDKQDKGWQASRPLGRELAVWRPPSRPSASPMRQELDEPSGPIDLRQALALALMNNPDLSGASWELRMAEARRLQSGLLPNPELSYEAEGFGPIRESETTLSVAQAFPLSGRLRREKEVAALERDLAGWDYEARRIAVLTETAAAFIAVVSRQERAALMEEAVESSRKLAEVAADRAKAGKAAPVEETRARIEMTKANIGLEQAHREVEASRWRLAALWGSTKPRFTKAAGRLDVASSIPAMERLADVLDQNPELARLAVEMRRRKASLALQRAKAVPDLAVTGGWKRDYGSGENGFAVGVSIPLPFFDRNQGGILEAAYGLAKIQDDRRAAEARLGRDLAEAYQALAAAHTGATLIKRQVIPDTEKVAEASLEAYRQGKSGYLEVLDAQRALIEARLQYIDAAASYHVSAAGIEGLIGQSLGTVEGDRDKREERP